MSWEDRITGAQYTSPSGKVMAFEFSETLTRETELKTGTYTFPGVDGAHVQHLGAGKTDFSIKCFFSGPDCMDNADAFEAMLIERGIGELKHPMYGIRKVVPTGSITREDDTVNRLNESSVSVTFTETFSSAWSTGAESAKPVSAAVAADTLEKRSEALDEAAAADFAETIAGPDSGKDTISEQLQTQSVIEGQTKDIVEKLDPVVKTSFLSKLTGAAAQAALWVATTKSLYDKINTLYQKVQNAIGKIDSVYSKALDIGRLTLRVIKMPSMILTSLLGRVQTYKDMVMGIINRFKNDPFGIRNVQNAFAAAKLALFGATASAASGAALSVVQQAAAGDAVQDTDTAADSAAPDKNTGVATREEAIQIANTLIEMLETVNEFCDTKTGQNVSVDSNATAYIALNDIVYTSYQLILDASFSFPLQRTITLDRDRQVIELVAELYGSIDDHIYDHLDDFIVTNRLNLDEIELIPMGRKVSYYVQST